MKTLDDAVADAVTALQAYSGDLFEADEVTRSVDVGETIQALTAGVLRQQQKLAVLCPLLVELVETAAALTVPEGCEVGVSASPDIIISRPDGHWMAFQKAQNLGDAGDGEQVWLAWRGSLTGVPRIGTLQRVVDYYGSCEP